MEKLPANSGWLWIKQGFGLFIKQPGALITLILLYGLFNMVVGIVPVLGQIALVLLVPVFSTAFAQACANIEQGQRVTPGLLFTGFRKPILPRLMTLGLLYMIVALLAMGLSSLVDDGMLLKLMTGQVNPNANAVRDANIGTAFLVAIAVCIPAAMGFCFAAPLIYWQNLSVGKAVFFSFFAVQRSLLAFIVFGISLFSISMIAIQCVLLVFGRTQLAMSMLLPLSMLLSVQMHCAFYASYRHIFGAPYEQAKPAVPEQE